MGKKKKKPTVAIAVKDREELKFSYIAGGYANGRATLENIWQFHIKLNINFLCDSAVLLLGIYPREMKIWSHKILYEMYVSVV